MSITLDIVDDIATITLDDGKANAINPDWMALFMEKFSEAEEGAKAIIITGRKGIFSGGFDLKWLAAEGPARGAELLDTAAQMVLQIFNSPRPVIAACTGHAIAMGSFVLLACDTRIGTAGDYRFGANETINNMNLPVFALELPKARLAGHKLTEALIQARLYTPEEAADIGYIDMVTDADELMTLAHSHAKTLAALPGRAYGANKIAVRKDTSEAIRASIGNNGIL